MAVTPGQTLSHYRLVEKIGEGGMGVVWKADDTVLGRHVAIKVLPDNLAHDAERLARFRQEARLLASLNHPNIAAIHGLEESDGVRYLVLELVPGQTLAERLARGPLPVDEALTVCRQIAEALEAAHETGIIHRDLKPANVKVTPDGKVKVLDFGLAKAFEGGPASEPIDVSLSPTLTNAGTMAGVILGTAAYMSPEQARGKPVDKRTDIWAFGCVMYECLTGRQAFPGETVSDTIAGILAREPDWEALPSSTPVKIRGLLQRCLRKNDRNRLHDIADVRIETEEVLSDPSGAAASALERPDRKTISSRWIPWIVTTVAVAGLIWNAARDIPTGTSKPIRASLELPPGVQVAVFTALSLALSPDGSRLVVVADRDGKKQLFVRELTGDKFVPIQGTGGARFPFFSPDGEWVAFTDYDDFKMKKVAIAGGEAVVICDRVRPGGGSWRPDDTIIFTRTWSGGLWRVPASGGVPEPLDPSDSEEGYGPDLWSQSLPGRSAVLYTRAGSSLDTARVMVRSLETGEQRTLVDGAGFGRYAPSGHLLYVRGTTLFGQPFDVGRLESTGPPVPVLDDIGVSGDVAVAQFTFSRDGTLAYIPHSLKAPPRQLVWVERDGTERAAAEQLGSYFSPSLSPDGGRLALETAEGSVGDVWIHDFVRDTRTRLTLETGFVGIPIWTPDGRRVVYVRARPHYDLFWSPADGSEPAELLYADELDKVPTSVSPDGTTLVFDSLDHPETGIDIWQIPLLGEREPTPLVRTPFAESGAMFSRDGHWIAFVSNESGRFEVYVQAFPKSHGKIRISNDGGMSPVWSRDGTALFYRNGSKTMAVDVETVPTFTAAKPRLLFTGQYIEQAHFRQYDVAPDGRFVMIKTPPDLAPRQVNIVLNWFEELKRLAPTGKD